MAPGYGKTVRSISKPDLTNAEPYSMTETDLQTESARLEKLLRDGQLPGGDRKRLQQVRDALEKFAALKRGVTTE